MELYKKYRPQQFSGLIGQGGAVAMLQDLGRRGAIPHCILLTGPSGCGKTTIARILQKKLKCSDQDFSELNIADVRGIDMVRSIRERMHLSPIGGKTRIWLLDEVARATVDAQNAFLKMLEDTPSHVYFILATTEPQKLLTTIKTRATEVKVKLLSTKDMGVLLGYVIGKEGLKVGQEVVEKIIEVAEGSPRKGLVLLNQIMGLTTEVEQLAVVSASTDSPEAIAVARALMKGAGWSEVAGLLKVVEQEPETVRRVILGYFSSVLIGGGKYAERAFSIIAIFEKNWFDSGRAGMIASCYEATTLGKSR